MNEHSYKFLQSLLEFGLILFQKIFLKIKTNNTVVKLEHIALTV